MECCNIIKVFVIGSTKLHNRRQVIAEVANKLTTRLVRGNDSKTAICVYSFENLESTDQKVYDQFIEEEADAVISILEDDFGSASFEEAKKARETNKTTNGVRPLLFGMLNQNIKDNEVSVCGRLMTLDNLRRELLEDTFYFETYTNKDFREHVESILREIVHRYTKKEASRRVRTMTWENDSFAYLTIEARFKENYKIVADNFSEGDFEDYDKFEEFHKVYKSECKGAVNRLIDRELQRFIEDNPEVSRYSGAIALKPFFRKIPFLLAEYYFYYYLLHLYHVGKKVLDRIEDPYRNYKLKHLNQGNDNKNFDALIDEFKYMFMNPVGYRPNKFLIGCLNMNSIDLSQLEINIKEFRDSNMPINDCMSFSDFMQDRLSTERENDSIAHIITDNCGFELMSDILLGSYLLKATKLTKVVYHVKRLPIFVSDTIMSDVEDAIEILNVKLAGLTRFRLCQNSTDEQVYVCDSTAEKQMLFKVSDCWHRETLFKDVKLFDEWNNDKRCSLIVVKGDLNYRRLVGDYNWSFTDSIKPRVDYIKKPLLIIRSLKSNVLLGVEGEEKYSDYSPNWNISGEYGIVQFVLPDDTI